MSLKNLLTKLSSQGKSKRRKSQRRKSQRRKASCRSQRRNSRAVQCGIESLEERIVFSGMYVGTNIDGVVDWGATAFVNVMNEARNWQTRNIDGSGPWTTELGDQVPTDEHGWPTHSPFDAGDGAPLQIVHTVIPLRGAGTYQWTVEGAGAIRVSAHDGLLDPNTPYGRSMDFEFNGGQSTIELEVHDSEYGNGIGNLYMEIITSDPADPIRNMDLVLPGHEATHESQPFLQSWTNGLAPFANIRFMDWGQTNNNPLQTWEERTTLDSYSQTRAEGVSLENQIALANQLQQDPWFTVPAAADDNYVRNMAAMIRDELDPNLKAFVEYSNETWNVIFQQTAYVQDRGEALRLDANRWAAGQKFVSLRSAEIWNLFEQQFGEQAPDRLVKVMATQASLDFLSDLRMNALLDPSINPSGTMPDALAIAPYFGSPIADQIVAEGLVDTITREEILDRAQADLRDNATPWVETHKALADEFGAWLITYEGGQHLVGTFENQTNTELTEQLLAANRDPRMYDLYTEYLDMLRDGGVVLHSNFSYIATPSRYGSWGVMEDQDQPLEEAHKYRALVDWAAANPVNNLEPTARAGADIQVVDDGDGVEAVRLDGSASRDLDGVISSYQWQMDGQEIGNSAVLNIDLGIGLHHLELTVTDNAGGTATDSVSITVAPSQAAEVLVESDFQGVAPGQNQPWTPATRLNDDLNFSGWSTGAGYTGSEFDNVLSFSGVFGPEETDLAEAIASDRYLFTSINATQTGAALDVRGAEFSFTIDRIDYHAPRRYVVTSSVDGHTADQILFDSGRFTSQAPESFTFTLPFDGFRTEESIEFRIYAFAGQYGGHDSSLAAFRLHGGIAGESVNSAPNAVDDVLTTQQDVSLVFTAAELLGNDTDIDGDALSIIEIGRPENGVLVDNGDGTFNYTPDAGFTGLDTFTYTISDGDALSPSPVDDVRQYTFNHSLWEDSFGNNAATGYWIGELANASGTDYAWNGQFGQLDYHRIGDYENIDSGPRPDLGSSNSEDVFPTETTHFRDINIDNVLIMPPNFVQAGSPTAQAEFIRHAQRVVDYVVDEGDFGGQHSEAPVYIYEHWQEADAFPLTASQWSDFHAVTTGVYHEWFLDYQDQLSASRPEVDFRMIPVGPIIADVLQNPELQASSLEFADLYRDNAPHGHPNAYFLAGLISYQAMYGQKASDEYAPPITADAGGFSDGAVSPEIASDFDALNDFVWERLNHYNDHGVRIWTGEGGGLTDTATVSINVNPVRDLVRIDLQILDESGQPVDSLETGETFILQGAVDDLREGGLGVFSAYLDVAYDSALAAIDGDFEIGDAYQNAGEGDTSTAGLIDEIGGVSGPVPLGEDPVTLFRVPMMAIAAGQLVFSSNAADLQPAHEITLYDLDAPVGPEFVLYGHTTIEVQLANQDPIAVDDGYSIFNDGVAMSFDVLANDSASEAEQTLSLLSVMEGDHGGQTEIVDNQVVYTPAADFYGQETFTYQVGDGNGGSAEAVVRVDVAKRWHNPRRAADVNDDTHISPLDALLVIHVLRNQLTVELPPVPDQSIANLPYIDVNDDHRITLVDALMAIDELRRQAAQRGRQTGAEGEAPAHRILAPSFADDTEATPRGAPSAHEGQARPLRPQSTDILIPLETEPRTQSSSPFTSYESQSFDEAIELIAEDVSPIWESRLARILRR